MIMAKMSGTTPEKELGKIEIGRCTQECEVGKFASEVDGRVQNLKLTKVKE